MQYRKWLYERYALLMRGWREQAVVAAADHQVAPDDDYLRVWLPGNPKAAILDGACGSGEFLRYFATPGYTQVEGVDISPKQVELAGASHPQRYCANALDFLNPAAGHYDLITARDVAEHLTKDEILAFLEGWGKALRAGGRLIVQTPNGAAPCDAEISPMSIVSPRRPIEQVFALSGFKDDEAGEMARQCGACAQRHAGGSGNGWVLL